MGKVQSQHAVQDHILITGFRCEVAHLVSWVPGHRQGDLTLLPGNDVLPETTEAEQCGASVNHHEFLLTAALQM